MEDLKVSLRIASIVFGIIIYCCVWRYIMDNLSDDSTVYMIVSITWIVLHIIGFVTAVVWGLVLKIL